jgi:hypothetical protein
MEYAIALGLKKPWIKAGKKRGTIKIRGCSHARVGRLFFLCEATLMGPAIGRWLQDFLKRSKAKQKVLAMARRK